MKHLTTLLLVAVARNVWSLGLSVGRNAMRSGLFRRSSARSLARGELKMSEEVPIRMCTFNILAPCYNRRRVSPDEDFVMESESPADFMRRNNIILDELERVDADIICLQEFWCVNAELRALYTQRLGGDYVMEEVRRSSHWRERDDGLAVFVRKGRFYVQDSRDIVFHDCGDRVAKMLLVACVPSADNDEMTGDAHEAPLPPQQFIVVNTHLLFPHNEYSTKIRLREVTKILGFVEGYRQRELCSSVCSRTDVRIPVLIAGDFNGTPEGRVHRKLVEQGFTNAYDSIAKKKWVSHRSHEQREIPVDHIFLSNPSYQGDADLVNATPVPDWTNLVYNEVYQRITDKYGPDGIREVFRDVNQDESEGLGVEEFAGLLRQLGFDGEGTPALTMDEVEALVRSADRNNNGTVDYKEFLDRIWLASEWREQTGSEADPNPSLAGADVGEFARGAWLLGGDDGDALRAVPGFEVGLDRARPLGDLEVKDARLFPSELEEGVWPQDWTVSDHGLVVVDFVGTALPEEDQAGDRKLDAEVTEEWPWEPPAELRDPNYVGTFIV